jgi:hypothetical protein
VQLYQCSCIEEFVAIALYYGQLYTNLHTSNVIFSGKLDHQKSSKISFEDFSSNVPPN